MKKIFDKYLTNKYKFYKKNKESSSQLIFLLIIISFIFILPSIVYLFQNKTLDGFNNYFSWSLKQYDSKKARIIDAICFETLFFLIVYIYIKIIKKEKEIFKNFKQMLLIIIIQSFIFAIAVPYATSDIFYYLGTGWLDSKYN